MERSEMLLSKRYLRVVDKRVVAKLGPVGERVHVALSESVEEESRVIRVVERRVVQVEL
jgi:hypothetical protein